MAGAKTKGTARIWVCALILALVAVAALVKWTFFPSIKNAYFAMNDRSLLMAPYGLVVVRPTHYSFLRRNSGINEASLPNHDEQWRVMGRDVPLRRIIGVAYDYDSLLVVMPPDAPTNNFDFLVTFTTNQEQHLQAAIRKTLGYSAHEEKRNMDVLALEITSPDLPGLKVNTNHIQAIPWGKLQDFRVRFLARQLERRLQQPVVDETGLTNYYDFDWDFSPHDRKTLDKMLTRLGLGLQSKSDPVNVLVVDRKQ